MAKIKQTQKFTGRARKETIVAQLVEKMDASNGLVFTDYKGLKHQQLENLKKELKKNNSTIIIAKNSLIKLSLGQSKNFAEFKENEGLELPTATLFIQGDMVEPLKNLQKLIKEAGLPRIKFGVLEGQLVDESGVLKIAALPSRETLIAQFVGMLNSPIQGLVVTLNGTIQKFVMTLDAVAKAKPADAPAPQPTPTTDTSAETATTETSETSGETPISSGAAPSDNSEQLADQSASAPANDTTEVPTDETAGKSADEVPSSDGAEADAEANNEKPETVEDKEEVNE
jgi:large subunit ribosomal protein L10